jgi:glycosyltransferase involved in cell wall biosynthesis
MPSLPTLPIPRISVALCVHNAGRFLAPQLDSLLAQEGVELEIVALDDCSTDRSLAILHEYAARDPRIRVYANEENLGYLKSFDACMALCTASLIAPCDHDDVWHPSKLATLAAAIGYSDLAYCDSEYIDEDGKVLGGRVSDDLKAMHHGRAVLPYVFQNTASGHAMLVRRELFELARPFPPMLFHDWWLAMRAAANGGVVYVDRPLVQFRRHGGAFSALGKEKVKRRTAHSRNRKWVEQRLYVFDHLASSGGSESTKALGLEWHRAFHEAMEGRGFLLAKLIWRHRAVVPPWHGPRWWAAVRCYLRCRNKIRLSRDEPEVASAEVFR